jgi:hypothetical protein
MVNNHLSGESGEQDIVALIACPNCGKKLMQLPKNYPLFDLQCTGCIFRAQVKTNNCKPKDKIFGAGWPIMEKVLKSGFMAPPLIANFKWVESRSNHQKILFFPFIPKSNLKSRTLKSTAKRENYEMFDYVGLLVLPSFVLYHSPPAKASS